MPGGFEVACSIARLADLSVDPFEFVVVLTQIWTVILAFSMRQFLAASLGAWLKHKIRKKDYVVFATDARIKLIPAPRVDASIVN